MRGAFVEIMPIFDLRLELGEGPQLDKNRKTLWFVDITGRRWFEADLDSKEFVSRQVQGEIGAIINVKPGQFLGLVKEGLAELDLNGGYKILDRFLSPSERMNDAKSDLAGRIWAGSTDINFTQGRGKLYRFDRDLKRKVMLDGLTLPNGMGWSPDSKTFFLIDSLKHVVWAFDFDLHEGLIFNQREFYRFLPTKGIPDGMCIDPDGNLFIAMWEGGTLEVLSPKGKLIKSVTLPVSKPTSCAFSGMGGSELIVTTSSQDINLDIEPLGGRLLAISGLN